VKRYKFILSGGGTAGHINPALAIAERLENRFPGSEIIFVGAKGRMEMEKVPKEGYKIKGLWISGFKRGSVFRNILLPFKIITSLIQSFIINLFYNPSMVVGTGGYASGPILFISSIMKIPTVIQEQNSFAGITNRLLSKRVDTILVAFSDMDKFFPKHKIVETGNPIRKNLLNISKYRNEAFRFFGFDPDKKIIGVLGGSLGAKKINEIAEYIIPFLELNDIQIIWQCGKMYYKNYQNREINDSIKIFPYIKNMNLFYSMVDLIISRAGALTISELCVVGKPSILIPSPNVTENHQMHNANYLKKNGAAEIVSEDQAFKEIEKSIKMILDSEKIKSNMKKALRRISKPKATDLIVNEINKLIK